MISALKSRVKTLESQVKALADQLGLLQLASRPHCSHRRIDFSAALREPITPASSPVRSRRGARVRISSDDIWKTPPSSPSPPSPSPSPTAAQERILVVFDFETNGIGATRNIRIRECGAVAATSTSKERQRAVAELPPFRKAVDPQVEVTEAVKAIAPDAPDATEAETWDVVGHNFHAWLETIRASSEPAPKIVLAAFNGKRFDSRIWAFENARHKVLNVPQDLYFVDLMEVFRTMIPDVKKPRTLAHYHGHVMKCPIASAHTALGDSYALRDIVNSLDSTTLWSAIDDRLETADGVYRRCGLNVPPLGLVEL